MFRELTAALAAVCALATLSAATADDIVHETVPDVELLNQDREPLRFVSEAIGDHLAAVTFTFTSCHTICPRLDGIFAQLQGEIGEELGRDTVLITVTVDPVNDIPERLKAHAEMMQAGPGWSFLTGDKDRVTELLKALEVFAPDILDHPPTVFVVDGRMKTWTRLSGFPSPQAIAARISEYRESRGEASTGDRP